jgi:ADP-ribose pyrophosphatase YjhB (NUDIX family)
MTLLMRLAYLLFRLKWRILRPVSVGVRIMLIKEETIWLVSHTYQAGWQFPGGGVKWGESLAAAAAREAYEEVGARLLRPPRLFGIYHNLAEGKSDHVALFLSEEFEVGQPTDKWEIQSRAAFVLNQLPADLGAGYRRRVNEYLAGQDARAEHW